MRINLGETVCDKDKNCYTDGVLVSAPLTSTPGQVGNVDPDSIVKVLMDNALPLMAFVAAIVVLNFSGSGGRRR